MGVAWTTKDETCPNCTEDTEVWVLEESEGDGIRLRYACRECRSQWSEVVGDDSEKRPEGVPDATEFSSPISRREIGA